MYITAQGPRLRNDLYCDEWEVKLYIPYHTIPRSIDSLKVTQHWQQVTRNSVIAENLRDAFIGQSRSPNIVPFHMLDIVFYCAIVTLSLRRAVFAIFHFKNVVTLKSGQRSLKAQSGTIQ